MMKSLLLSLFTASFTLTASAQDAKPLGDGKTLAGWVKADGSSAEGDKGWEVVDGVIHRTGKSGDLLTAKEYADFEFEWDWKISSGGNSGVKYRVTRYGKDLLGPEYQMLDDDKHSDGKLLTHKTGCIYDLFPTIDNKPVKPVGEWNHSKIVAKGGKFEHWLNGTKVAECDTSSPVWKETVAKSKFKSKADWALNPKGKIMLQDHGDEVWFRNLTIKEL
jgi:Domain of Unknown Function (DUF1080)